MSALNRFLQEEVFLVEEVLSSTPPSSSPPRPAASTQSEKRVARSWRSSFTSRSFCRMSAGEEDTRSGEEGKGAHRERMLVSHDEATHL